MCAYLTNLQDITSLPRWDNDTKRGSPIFWTEEYGQLEQKVLKHD